MKTYKLLYNTTFLFLSKAIYVSSLFIIFAIVVRCYSRADANLYALALAFNNFFIFMADFGTVDIVIRRSSIAEKDDLFAIFLSGLLVKLVYALGASLVIFFAIRIMYDDALTRYAILIFCFNAVIYSFSEYIDGIATGVGRTEIISFFNFIQYAALLGMYWRFSVIAPQPIISLMWWHTVVVAIFLLVRIRWVHQLCEWRYKKEYLVKCLKGMLKDNPAFGVSSIVEYVAGTHLYIIAISLFQVARNDLAVFQGAFKIFGFSYLVGAIICRSLFAATSLSIIKQDEAELRLHVNRAFHMMGVVFIFIFSMLFNMGDKVMKLLYGGQLPGSETILSYLIIALPVGYFGFVADALLPAANLQRVKTLINVATLVVAVPIVYLFTKNYGIKGTAISWVVISFGKISCLLVAQYVYFKFVPNWKELWKIVLSAGIIGCGFWFLKNELSLIPLLLIGGVSYILLLLVFKEDEAIFPSLRNKLRLIFLKPEAKES